MKYYVKVYSYKAWKRLLYMSLGREKAEKKLDAYRSKVGSSDYAQASPMMRAILSKVVNEDLKSVMPPIKAETLLVWGEMTRQLRFPTPSIWRSTSPMPGLCRFPDADITVSLTILINLLRCCAVS